MTDNRESLVDALSRCYSDGWHKGVRFDGKTASLEDHRKAAEFAADKSEELRELLKAKNPSGWRWQLATELQTLKSKRLGELMAEGGA